MPPAFVQGVSWDAGQVTTAVHAYPSNNTAGNLLVCVFYGNNATGTWTISDSQSNTWVPIYNTAFGIWHTASWYALNCKGGANTVTINNAGGSANWMRQAIGEWGGVPATATVEGPSAWAAGNASASVTTNSLTTTGSQDLIIAIEAQADTVGFVSINNGFTQQNGAGGNQNYYEAWFADKVGGPGTYSTTATYGSSFQLGAGLIAFVAPSGAPNRNLMGVGQ